MGRERPVITAAEQLPIEVRPNSLVPMGNPKKGGNRPCQEPNNTANMRQRQSNRPSARPIATRKKVCRRSPDNGASWPNKSNVASLSPSRLLKNPTVRADLVMVGDVARNITSLVAPLWGVLRPAVVPLSTLQTDSSRRGQDLWDTDEIVGGGGEGRPWLWRLREPPR
jgi:hypothetical protein